MTRPRVLVLRALGMGDLLTAVPALRGLAATLPDHRLVLAAPAWLAPLVRLVDAVDEHVEVDELAPLPASLDGVELAVNLHGSGPQSHRLLLDRAPRRLLAYAHPDVPESADGPDWDGDEHEVARWCRLLASAGIPAIAGDLGLAAPGPPPEAIPAGATIVHPGAKSGARRWPAERFAAVAERLAADGHDVVVTGSPEERPLARSVAERAGLPDTAVAAGRTGLAGLAAGVAAARAVVAGDTGVGHLATALATPSVLLFGPTPPATWGPPTSRADRHRVLWRGATGDPLADAPFPGLLGITVDDVLAEVVRLPAPDGPRVRRRSGGPSS